jgi:hypothetical protein
LTADQILKEIRTGMYKESCPLCVGEEEEVERILLCSTETKNIIFMCYALQKPKI